MLITFAEVRHENSINVYKELPWMILLMNACRAARFIIYDLADESCEVLDNKQVYILQGAGIQSAQM